MVELGWVAFDVGARKHAYAARMGGREDTGELENSPEAIARFLKARQGRCKRLRVLMEATGIYYLDLALQAVQAGAEVMVINPKAAHHFARAMGLRNKTDALDARMLLAYLERMQFQPWQPPDPARLGLRQFGRHLGQLTEQRARLKNQLHALSSTRTTPRVLREDLETAIADLDRRLARLTAEAMKLVDADPAVRERFDALDSIVGVGPATALALLGELLVLPPDMNARACVCHAGLDVRVHQSGTSVALAPRLSKHGNKHLRRALYMPAMAAIAHDPHAKAFRDRLLGRGKKKMQALAAVMRKLLTAAWALVRHPAQYDGSKLFAGG
jgi:transposase